MAWMTSRRHSSSCDPSKHRWRGQHRPPLEVMPSFLLLLPRRSPPLSLLSLPLPRPRFPPSLWGSFKALCLQMYALPLSSLILCVLYPSFALSLPLPSRPLQKPLRGLVGLYTGDSSFPSSSSKVDSMHAKARAAPLKLALVSVSKLPPQAQPLTGQAPTGVTRCV